MIKDDVLNDFISIKGIGKVKAELLYNNGYVSLDDLKLASVKDLTKLNFHLLNLLMLVFVVYLEICKMKKL